MVKTKLVSSLEKIFAQSEGNFYAISSFSMLKKERSNFQLAVFTDEPLRVEINGADGVEINAFNVLSVPSALPYYEDHDDDILVSPDGYYPDCLVPCENGEIEFVNGGWCSVWFEVSAETAGEKNIELSLYNEENELVAKESMKIKVIDVEMPEQELICTNWFHCDCLATWYKAQAFSEEHWQIIENYVRVAVKHGINMLLTPLFTPPLDTAVGGERPTMQLVDVTVTGKDEYAFGFDKLSRWIKMALSCGVKQFELSHLFTQWGASHAPKIVDTNGKLIFGWKTAAGGKKYKAFLTQFAAALDKFLIDEKVKDRCWVHVSDEPNDLQVRSYAKASRLIRELFPDYKNLDALSNFKYYKKGLVKTPVPSLDHAHKFYGKVDGLWTYYCCGQYKGTSNRFMAMPSYRNRVLGLQLFKFNCVGFLQWGYNFWYSQHSKRTDLNPFEETDAGKAFPSGDAFMVYPGENGQPLISLRFKVFYDAFQDYAALKLLEKKIGHEKAVEVIENNVGEPLGFTNYEKGIAPMLEKREKVNALLEELY
ncbi:MAG: DUF4091 domain-containing protein [Clostridia bacterium]|nr:DUF4091 domain-containing protein [Clostridia bacterium]